MQKPFKKVVRTMEGLDVYVNPMFWVSLLVGGIALAAISYGFQMAQDDGEEKQLNVKGIIRDVLLGGIFTAIGWTLAPDTMKSITSSFKTTVSSAATTVASTASAVSTPSTTTQSGGTTATQTLPGDVDIQVGPARF